MPLDKINEDYIQTYLAFLQQGEAVADCSLEKYPRLPIYFENSFGFLNKSIKELSSRDLAQYPRPQLECLLFYSKSFSTIYVAMDVAYKGHYAEAMALTRMVYESFTRIAFISTYPERDGDAFDFNTFKIRNVEQRMKYNLYDLYKLLSTRTHSHKVDVVNELYNILQKQHTITIGSLFDDEQFTACYNLILFFLWGLMSILPRVFPQLLDDSDWLKEYHLLEVEVGRWFREHPKEFWNQAIMQVELAKVSIFQQGNSGQG
jgi:hypothetical protein